MVSLIDEQGKELTGLADRLLGAARLDQAEFKPKLESLLLSELVRDTIEAVEDQKCRARFRISAPDHEAPVLADRKLIRGALAQLIDNAIKYSVPGSPIDVEIASANSDGARPRLGDRTGRSSAYLLFPYSSYPYTDSGRLLSLTK